MGREFEPLRGHRKKSLDTISKGFFVFNMFLVYVWIFRCRKYYQDIFIVFFNTIKSYCFFYLDFVITSCSFDYCFLLLLTYLQSVAVFQKYLFIIFILYIYLLNRYYWLHLFLLLILKNKRLLSNIYGHEKINICHLCNFM